MQGPLEIPWTSPYISEFDSWGQTHLRKCGFPWMCLGVQSWFITGLLGFAMHKQQTARECVGWCSPPPCALGRAKSWLFASVFQWYLMSGLDLASNVTKMYLQRIGSLTFTQANAFHLRWSTTETWTDHYADLHLGHKIRENDPKDMSLKGCSLWILYELKSKGPFQEYQVLIVGVCISIGASPRKNLTRNLDIHRLELKQWNWWPNLVVYF